MDKGNWGSREEGIKARDDQGKRVSREKGLKRRGARESRE